MAITHILIGGEMASGELHGGRALGIVAGIAALVLLLTGGVGAATLTVNASAKRHRLQPDLH